MKISLDLLKLDEHPERDSVEVHEVLGHDIAIIGMAVKMPNAETVEEFWQNLQSGSDSTRDLPEDRRRDADRYLQAKGKRPEDIKYMQGSYLDGIDKFDYDFFRLTPQEANLMSPMHRLVLETAWATVEDAGYGGNKLDGTETGVYLGFIGDLEGTKYKEMIEQFDENSISVSVSGNLASMIPGRVSYTMNLKGPSVLIDTACSSSMVAVDHACKAIRNGSCEMAIAGGVRLTLLPVEEENHKIGIESQDSLTRTYDEKASGSGMGEGIGLVFLKSLDQAVRDKDSIYAVIKGSAVNQDGTSMGITAPNPASQEKVIVKAWEDAGVDPETISYIEVHGTGTRLGDTIEIDGLRGAFAQYTDKQQFCAISSVKTNIGHLYESAGVAGLVKTIMALRNKQMPPSLHFQHPNQKIDFLNSPIYVNAKLRPWEAVDGLPRRAGVSSFGLSGTNCHLVLEEAPPAAGFRAFEKTHVLTLSAKSEAALQELIERYASYVSETNFRLTDVCYTASTGRHHHSHRLALILNDEQELRNVITQLQAGIKPSQRVFYGVTESAEAPEDLTREAKKLVRQMSVLGEWESALVERVSELYVQGADVEWESFWRGADARRVHLPVYPFQRKRCWVRMPEVEKADLFYTMKWVEESMPVQSEEAGQGAVLIFADQRGLGEQIAARYQEEGRRCLTVTLGEQYEQVSGDRYTIRGEEADYVRLFAELKDAGLTQIVHLFAYTGQQEIQEVEDLEESQRLGVYSLFYLTRAAVNNQIADTIDVCLIADHVMEVSGQESYLKPESAPLFGLGKAVSLEYHNLRCRTIDVEGEVDLDLLLRELKTVGGRYQTAHRDGKRFVEQFTEVEPNTLPDHPVTLTADGIYLITGGLGGIGLEIAKWFAAQGPVRLAMVNRSPMPPREQWEQLLEADSNSKIAHRIRALREIEAMGTTVECYATDISNPEPTRRLLEQLRSEHGKILGVVHAAGNPGDGFLVRKEHSVFDDVIRPKVQGTWVLDQLTAEDDLQFFILFSSGIAILGEAGQGDYVAANAYLDAYVAGRNRLGKPTTTIDWVAWKSAGTSVEYGFNVDWVFKAIPTEQALHGFGTVLQKVAGRVLIGELNFNSPYMSIFNNLSFDVSPKVRRLIEPSSRQTSAARAPHQGQNMATAGSGTVRLTGNDGASYSEIEMKLAQMYRDLLGFDEINVEDSFFELGGNSLMLNRMHAMLEAEFPGKVKVSDLFAHTSVAKLAKHIGGAGQAPKLKIQSERKQEVSDDDIAVIGLAVDMPMAGDADAFWSNILSGLDCTGPLPEQRKQDLQEYLQFAEGVQPGEVRFVDGAFLDNIDEFDYRFFKMTPAEAKLTDPHQRLFLKTVWHALEDSGYGERLSGTNTGVYVGYATHLKDSYLRMIGEIDPELGPVSIVGNISSMLPSRICYFLNLKGPAVVVDTACSSALVAIHTACRDLKSGECDTAIVAGVRVGLMPLDLDHLKIGIESGTGRTMTFDNSATGSGIGEGAAAVLLKPLKQAIADNDRIYAVVKGSAYNQDGTSMGITAPNPTAQEEVLVKAWQKAGVDPETLSFIECHGTATPLGDPIEVDALERAFRHFTDRRQFCAVRSVKSNIGHLFEAAGVTSFVTGVLALKNKTIPPSLNFNRPNAQIQFADSPVYVNTLARKWEHADQPMRAGISSFGFSGTNCHVVIEEWNQPEQTSHAAHEPQVLTLSAKSESSFQELLKQYQAAATDLSAIDLRDLCYTASTGRGHYQYRLALVVQPGESLAEKLHSVDGELDQSAQGIFYGYHRINDRKDAQDSTVLTEREKQELSNQAAAKLASFLQSGKREPHLLTELCQLYTQGATIEWGELFTGEAPAKVKLPVYPFEKNRCWIEVPSQAKERKVDKGPDRMFTIGWKPEPLQVETAQSTDGAVLILLDEKGRGQDIAARYRAAGRPVIEVEYADAFNVLADGRYAVDGSEASYTQLFAQLGDVPVTKIIHLHTVRSESGVTTIEQLDESQQRGFWNLFHLVRAWAKLGVETTTDLVLISEHGMEVTGAEAGVHPEHATLYGFGKSVRKEHPELVCRAIDLDTYTTTDQFFAELEAVTDLYLVAYRTGTRFVKEFTEIDEERTAEQPIEIKEDGVYLITGGMGGIGLEVARYLAEQNRVRLVLMNRSAMPERGSWQEILDLGTDEGLCRKIRDIQDIESRGAEVLCVSVDVANREQLSLVLANIREQYGRIDGVVHGAGVPSDEAIVVRKPEHAQSVFDPKLYGTWNLDMLTRDDNLDFMVLFSSIATLFSAPNQADYTAANTYLDSYAAHRNKQGLRTLTINWSTWKETGMSVRHNINTDTLFKAIHTRDAISGLDRALNKSISRALIGEIHYEGQLIFLLERNLFRLSPKITAELAKRKSAAKGNRDASSEGKASLSTTGDASYLEIERNIYETCKKALGFDDISIYDNFFELGADSILLTRMHALLDKEYPGLVVVTDIFEHTTIHRLAQFIYGKTHTPAQTIPEQKEENLDDALRSIFDQLENDDIDLEAALNNLKGI